MYQEDVLGETRFDEVTTRYRGALESIRGEFFYRMITSDVDVDDAWDDYVASGWPPAARRCTTSSRSSTTPWLIWWREGYRGSGIRPLDMTI